MTKPLDRYDLRDWATDSKLCWVLAIAEIRKTGVIEGRFKPIDSGELDLVWGW